MNCQAADIGALKGKRVYICQRANIYAMRGRESSWRAESLYRRVEDPRVSINKLEGHGIALDELGVESAKDKLEGWESL